MIEATREMRNAKEKEDGSNKRYRTVGHRSKASVLNSELNLWPKEGEAEKEELHNH